MKNISINITLIFASITLLCACSVNKTYKPVELDLPKIYRGEPSVTADTVQLPWRIFFRDPILVDLIERALRKNNDIAVAVMNLRQADMSYKQAKLQLLPALDVNSGASRTWPSKNSLNGSLSQQFAGTKYMDDYNAAFSFSWEIDIWGKAKMQKEDALVRYFMQAENLNALSTRIIAEVAQAYYNLISLDQQLQVASRNVELVDSTLNMIRLQYNSGLVSSLGLEQALAQKKTAELLIPQGKLNILIQENALSILCGNYPELIQRHDNLDTVKPVEIFATGIPAMLLSRRPDIKIAEYAVRSATARMGLSKADMYPTFSLSASAGVNAFKFNNWFSLPGSVAKNIGLNLSQPIFRKKALKTAYAIAVIDQEKSIKQFKQSVLVAVAEVSDVLATMRYADERLLLISEKKQALEKGTANAILLYKNAMANYLEVITAQNNSLQNDLEAISIKKEKLIAMTNLYRALGGGQY